MRPPSVLAVFVLLASFAGDAQEVLVRNKPDPSIPPLGVRLRMSVVNVELLCKQGNGRTVENGTGFVVTYPDARLPKNSTFDYLVTNRHVAECWEEPAHRPREVQSLIIRANTKNGFSKGLVADPHAWRFPSDDSVDLAVMSIVPSDDLQIAVIPVGDFATKDFLSSNQIAEGSPIILAGYFYQFPGERTFQPIVRQGILSMMPDEPMETTTGKPGTIYLGDVHIFGGNSGSPLLISSDVLGVGGYHLLGVVSGFYKEDQEFKLEIATTVQGSAKVNSGISMIVPSDLLKALLDGPEFKAEREAYFASQAKSAKK